MSNRMFKIILAFFLFTAMPLDADELPALTIKRIANDGGALAATLKLKYDQCVQKKALVAKLERERIKNPIAWEAAKESYEKSVIKFAKLPPASEPAWASMADKRVEEYFDQGKYASKTYTSRYKIDIGTCKLLKREDLLLRIDDGVTDSRIEFKGKKDNVGATPGTTSRLVTLYKKYKVKQRPSPRSYQSDLQSDIESLKNMPAAVRALAEAASLPRGRAPQTEGGSLPGQTEIDLLKKAFGYEKSDYPEHHTDAGAPVRDGEQIVAGQACDMSFSKTFGARVCLWNRMHRYPDERGMEVVLLKESKLGKWLLHEKATDFVLSEHLDPKIFKIPGGVRLR